MERQPPAFAKQQGREFVTIGELGTVAVKDGKVRKCDEIIQEQLRDGVVEDADSTPVGREFYLPHKAVIRENAQTTKKRIVYGASSKANEASPSLNDCLETGPPLQNKLSKVLLRGRFHPVALVGYIRKAFLQVRIRADDSDALRFHGLHNKDHLRVRILRFTRALFGLASSPFLLGGVIQYHLDGCTAEHPDAVEEIQRSLYVNDLVRGEETVEQIREKKSTFTEIFSKATFTLHKWNSNEQELEVEETQKSEDNLSSAKQELGVTSGECGLLELKWKKEIDEIGVAYPSEAAQPSRRSILDKIAKIYDPLGLVSPTILQRKMLYREACDGKYAWDAPLPEAQAQR